MSLNRIKLIAIVLVLVPMIAVVGSKTNVGATRVTCDEQAAATYKAKCAMCHTPTASKFFDPARAEEEMVAAILNGKKGEKPPYMPGFGDKGITADQAKELVKLMKSLKTGQ